MCRHLLMCLQRPSYVWVEQRMVRNRGDVQRASETAKWTVWQLRFFFLSCSSFSRHTLKFWNDNRINFRWRTWSRRGAALHSSDRAIQRQKKVSTAKADASWATAYEWWNGNFQTTLWTQRESFTSSHPSSILLSVISIYSLCDIFPLATLSRGFHLE